MIAVNFTTARSRFKDFCDKVTDEDETVIRPAGSYRQSVCSYRRHGAAAPLCQSPAQLHPAAAPEAAC